MRKLLCNFRRILLSLLSFSDGLILKWTEMSEALILKGLFRSDDPYNEKM